MPFFYTSADSGDSNSIASGDFEELLTEEKEDNDREPQIVSFLEAKRLCEITSRDKLEDDDVGNHDVNAENVDIENINRRLEYLERMPPCTEKNIAQLICLLAFPYNGSMTF